VLARQLQHTNHTLSSPPASLAILLVLLVRRADNERQLRQCWRANLTHKPRAILATHFTRSPARYFLFCSSDAPTRRADSASAGPPIATHKPHAILIVLFTLTCPGTSCSAHQRRRQGEPTQQVLAQRLPCTSPPTHAGHPLHSLTCPGTSCSAHQRRRQ
jgi:hypothetical protein